MGYRGINRLVGQLRHLQLGVVRNYTEIFLDDLLITKQ